MEGIKMRRSKLKKIVFILFLVLIICAGYYVYTMNIKSLYEKYSRLVKEQEERDRRYKIQGQFNIDNKGGGGLHPSKHDGQHYIPKNKHRHVMDEHKREREVVGGVEFIVDHNGESVGHRKSNRISDTRIRDALIKRVKNNEGPIIDENMADKPEKNAEDLLKIHKLMESYRKRIKVGDPIQDNIDGNQIAVVANEGDDAASQENLEVTQAETGIQQSDVAVNEYVEKQNLNSVNNDAASLDSQKWQLMNRLGIDGPLDDRKIMSLIISGKVSSKISSELMKFHSSNRARPPPPPLPPVAPDIKPMPKESSEREEFQKHGVAALEMGGGLPFKSMEIYDLHHKADLMYKCVKLTLLRNETTICLNNPLIDKPISAALAAKGIWESQNLNEFQRALVACPTCGVIDLGANLGVYSITAAQYGRQVVSVEPFLQNIGPFHKSVQLNQFTENIILLKNAISDKHGYMKMNLAVPPNNLGAVYAVPIEYKDVLNGEMDANIVKAITLDDIKHVVSFPRAILKVDIQGAEHSMFKSSKTFLHDVDVPFIFMHWAYEEYKQETMETADYLILNGYKPKITIGGTIIGVEALKRDQSLLIWAKQYTLEAV